jgi:hypothetical protein
MLTRKNKKGVSLMVSYVLLIAIVVGISIAVYAWLVYVSNVNPPADCEEGTSLILADYSCGPGGITLFMKNNGRFNVNGFVLAIGNDSDKEPVTYPYAVQYIGKPGLEGHYSFTPKLEPGQEDTRGADFSKSCRAGSRNCATGTLEFENITIIRIQAFTLWKGQKIMCQNPPPIKQNIENCKIN